MNLGLVVGRVFLADRGHCGAGHLVQGRITEASGKVWCDEHLAELLAA